MVYVDIHFKYAQCFISVFIVAFLLDECTYLYIMHIFLGLVHAFIHNALFLGLVHAFIHNALFFIKRINAQAGLMHILIQNTRCFFLFLIISHMLII